MQESVLLYTFVRQDVLNYILINDSSGYSYFKWNTSILKQQDQMTIQV